MIQELLPPAQARRAGIGTTDSHDEVEIVTTLESESATAIPHKEHAVFASARRKAAASVITVALQVAHRARPRLFVSIGSNVMSRAHLIWRTMAEMILRCNIIVRCAFRANLGPDQRFRQLPERDAALAPPLGAQNLRTIRAAVHRAR